MVKKLYVGNLPFSATEGEVQELFAQHGTVQSVNLITDRETGRPRGFGFVEMYPEGADTAKEALNGALFGDRNLRVNDALEPRKRGQDRDQRRSF